MAFKRMAESKDGKCPHCASTFVVKTSGLGDDIDKDKMDGEKEITYKCYTCNKDFYCIVPE
jgi:DNA-directed RNA polymerase subunit RPC12/RpoP